MASTQNKTAGENQVRGLAEQSSRVIEDIRDLGHIAASTAGDAVNELRSQGADALKASKKKATELKDDFEETVFDNPWKSVLIAAGIGALVGFALRRSR